MARFESEGVRGSPAQDSGSEDLTVPTLRVARSLRFPVRLLENGVMHLTTNELVTNGVVGTPARFGYPLHIVDVSGRILESFGLVDEYRGLAPTGVRNILLMADAFDGNVWVAHLHRYDIELWNVNTGVLRNSTRYDRDWFPDSADKNSSRPAILAIQASSDGYLWVVGRHVPRALATQRQRTADSRSQMVNAALPVPRHDWRLVIEVIDVSDMTVVASIEWAGFYGGFVSAGELFSFDQDQDGKISLRLWQAQLNIPEVAR